MSILTLSLALALLPQSGFTAFSFCRGGPGDQSPVHCIELDERGEGVFAIRSEDEAEALEESFGLSGSALDEFLQLLEDTDYLSEASEYESGGRAANGSSG